MKYTKHFGSIVKDMGTPNLSQRSFQKMMNIIWIEGQIEGLKKAKQIITHEDEKHRYDVLFFTVQKQLTELTGNMEPQEVIKGLIKAN